jgi:hypothetical protein
LGNLSANVNYTAIDLLKQTPERIDWNLSFNSNTEAVELLKQNPIKLIGADYHLMTARKRLSC